MDPISAIRRAFRPGGSASDKSYGIVLLERQHHFVRKDTLRIAAERAYNRSFAPGDPNFNVSQSTSTFVKLGPEDSIHIVQSSTPHDASPHEVRLQGDAHVAHNHWIDHKGYVTFEMWNRNRSKAEAYRLLAPLVYEFLTERVVGLYFPRDNEFFPNDGSAEEHLRNIAV
jgi:hypothetical protein